MFGEQHMRVLDTPGHTRGNCNPLVEYLYFCSDVTACSLVLLSVTMAVHLHVFQLVSSWNIQRVSS